MPGAVQTVGLVITAGLQGAGFQTAASGLKALGTQSSAAAKQMQQVSAQGGILRGALKGVGTFLTGPAGLALGAGATATALGAMARSAVNAADELGKASTRTGVSVEAISSLEVAARQGGTSLATLETGLAGMSRRAADAAAGSASAGRGFAALGISVTDATGGLRDADTLYGEVADALSRMEDGSEKAALAQQLFGRGGAQLIPVLNQGAEALRNNVTTSNELARSSEALNDRMDDIRVVFQQAGNAVLKGLVPPLAKLLTATVDGAKELRERFAPAWTGVSKTFGEVSRVVGIVAVHVGQNLFGVLKSVGDLLRTLFGPAINAVQSAFRGLGTDAPVLGRALSSLAAFFVALSGRVTELTQRIIGGATAALKFAQTIGAIVRLDFGSAREHYRGIGEAWATAAANADATRQRTDEAAEAIRTGANPEAVTFAGTVGSVAEAWATTAGNISGGGKGASGGTSVKAAIAEVDQATRDYYQAQGELEAERFERVKTNIEQSTVIRFLANQQAADDLIANETRAFTSRQSQIKEQEKVEKQSAENYRKEIAKTQSAWQQVANTLRTSVQGAIAGLISGTQSWGQALSRIANSVLNSIINKFAQLATSSIFNAVAGRSGVVRSVVGAGASAAAGAAGKALAGGGAAAGVGKVVGGIGKAVGGIGKALGGIGSALLPVAGIGAAVFGLSKLFGGGGESKDAREQRLKINNLDKEAILSAAGFRVARYIGGPSPSHPEYHKVTLKKQALDATPERKIRIALTSKQFRQVDKTVVAEILRKNLDKFARGGIVPRTRGGRLSLIGEGRHNEAVVPLPGGRAIPVEFKGPPPGSGGGTVNVTVNITQTDSGASVIARSGSSDTSTLEQRLTDWALTNLQPGGLFAEV